METISNFTNDQLTMKIKNLLKTNFKKCKILNNLVSETIYLDCEWKEWEYTTSIYLEKITNPNCKYQITVGIDSFPYSEKGINQAVNYINY